MKNYFVLLLLFLANAGGFPQDTTGTVVIISDKVGPIIDLEERNFYRMFLSVQNFESAVLLHRPDSSYIFKVITKKEDEPSVVVLIDTTSIPLSDVEQVQVKRVDTAKTFLYTICLFAFLGGVGYAILAILYVQALVRSG
jgi:hypothetical protein